MAASSSRAEADALPLSFVLFGTLPSGPFPCATGHRPSLPCPSLGKCSFAIAVASANAASAAAAATAAQPPGGVPSPPERPSLFVTNVRRSARSDSPLPRRIDRVRVGEVRPSSVAAGVAADVAARRRAIAPTTRDRPVLPPSDERSPPSLPPSDAPSTTALNPAIPDTRAVWARCRLRTSPSPRLPSAAARRTRRLLLRLATRRRARDGAGDASTDTEPSRPRSSPHVGSDGHLVRVLAPAGAGWARAAAA